ncbi:MAG: cache domain-containing protein, partial [Oscillospiraceae bacterium]
MIEQNHYFKTNKKIYRITAGAAVVLCGMVCLLCFQYYARLQKTISDESCGYMKEISSQMGTNVNKIIDNKYAVLNTLALVLKGQDLNDAEQMSEIVEEQREIWHFQELLLIDQKGVAHDERGNTVALHSDEYLQEVIVRRQAAVSTSQQINGRESVIFAIPLQGVVIEGTEMLALAISYDLSTFDQIVAMTAFDGKGYAHLVRSDGTAVVRSSSPDALQTGYNILNSLAPARIRGGRTLDEIKAEIANGKSGQVEFVLGDAREYMTYTPLENQRWSLLMFVPAGVVNTKSTMLLKITLMVCGSITGTFALLIGVLATTFLRNKHRLEQIAYVDPVTGGNT